MSTNKDHSPNEIIKLLLSPEPQNVMEGLDMFLQRGTLAEIPFLLIALEKWIDTPLEYAVSAVLFSIKRLPALEYIIQGMKNTSNPRVKTILLQSIWENEYDPTPHLEYIVEEVITGTLDFISEAICLFSALPTPINEQALKNCLRTLKNAKFTGDKQKLVDALMSTIEEKLVRHYIKQATHET